MNVKLEYYRVFCKVAECKSFSGAAKLLYMTQPAVSQTIMHLEEELDSRLFTRGTRGVSLTTEGQVLYEHVSAALEMIQTGESRLCQAQNLQAGDLKIGVGDAISKFFLLKHLEYFHTQYPAIKLKIINRTTPEQCELLKSGAIDLAFCNLPIEDNSIEVRECFQIHDIFVGGENYKKLSKNPIPLEELAQLPLIFLEKKSNSRQYVERYLAKQNIKISPEIELGSHDLLLEIAKINLGIACVIKEFSAEYLEQKGVYEIRLMNPVPRRSIGCCFVKNISLSPAATKFLEIVEKNNRKI
ncbi:MAG: LysR family transcriptional regulator [Cellulosilyticaceae bacterium]